MMRTIALMLIPFLAAPALAAEPIEGPVRLLLRSGATYDVPGSIETTDGRWVFRDNRGRLLSLDPELVRDVVPLGARRTPGVAKTSPAAPVTPVALRYTNADLPPPPPEPPGSSSEPDASEPSAAEPAAVEPPAEPAAPATEAAAAAPAAAPTAVPRVVGGHDEGWWRKRVAERREEIAALEQQEHTAHRLLVCAQHGVLGSSGCDPMLRAKPNWLASTPSDRALVEQLRQTRSRLEDRREALTGFLDEAFKLGVPTSWLL